MSLFNKYFENWIKMYLMERVYALILSSEENQSILTLYNISSVKNPLLS